MLEQEVEITGRGMMPALLPPSPHIQHIYTGTVCFSS